MIKPNSTWKPGFSNEIEDMLLLNLSAFILLNSGRMAIPVFEATNSVIKSNWDDVMVILGWKPEFRQLFIMILRTLESDGNMMKFSFFKSLKLTVVFLLNEFCLLIKSFISYFRMGIK